MNYDFVKIADIEKFEKLATIGKLFYILKALFIFEY
jgi:hypothetical protein